mmetsp:Transcript_28443/g.91830  ORF Transcript_28443/g.91830 Transcript_28443/m.91830 type:complete len:98 (+) Transcript_28443:119-412(+)|eukprot:scaffold34051_cov124-Isochrysis_galbana.AAC.2
MAAPSTPKMERLYAATAEAPGRGAPPLEGFYAKLKATHRHTLCTAFHGDATLGASLLSLAGAGAEQDAVSMIIDAQRSEYLPPPSPTPQVSIEYRHA